MMNCECRISGGRAPERTLRHRPPRLSRIFQHIRPFFFITFNTHHRRALLDNKVIHDAFRAFCINGQEWRVGVGRYVIMPDHIHLFVLIPNEGITLKSWVQSMTSVLGKTLITQGVSKPHWQEGFFDHLLRSGESCGEKWNYVRRNPVRAGLVKVAEDWPYQGEVLRLEF